MGRIYYLSFESIAVTLAQDLMEITPADDKPLLLHAFGFSQSSDTDIEQLQFSVRRFTATVTSGNGTALTARKQNNADAAASFAAERNGTTRATTSGTNELLFAEGVNVLSAWGMLFTPETRPLFTHGEACILGLEVAPTDAITMSGWAIVEEA